MDHGCTTRIHTGVCLDAECFVWYGPKCYRKRSCAILPHIPHHPLVDPTYTTHITNFARIIDLQPHNYILNSQGMLCSYKSALSPYDVLVSHLRDRDSPDSLHADLSFAPEQRLAPIPALWRIKPPDVLGKQLAVGSEIVRKSVYRKLKT
jgi:hypothetical protein